jgi:TetR/AcrR family transcriptional repressor of mexJK operon
MLNNERVGRPVDHSKDEAILNAVRALLFTKSPKPFSIDTVARKAKVSKMTIYSRYSTREALIEATVQRQARSLSSSIKITPDTPQDIKNALTHFGTDLLSFILSEDYLGYMRALSATPGISPETLLKIYESGPLATLNKLSDWLNQAHNNGLGNFSHPVKDAEMLIGMLIGLDMIRAMYGEPCKNGGEKIEQHVEKVVNSFLKISGLFEKNNLQNSQLLQGK